MAEVAIGMAVSAPSQCTAKCVGSSGKKSIFFIDTRMTETEKGGDVYGRGHYHTITLS